ncbi:Snurportin-1 [Morella rubra]|uniref:Snurportin-1 n=1 Tax=Morella rubra TaxID=262757 RepID=A0A6A1VZ79_9ROSI|nr:Snurportin-1 [Morella rubra]
MAPHDLRRPFKRPAISDQQRRREISLQRQAQNRRDAQQHARCLASTLLYLQFPQAEPASEPELELESVPEFQAEFGTELEVEFEASPREFDIRQASKLKGSQARKWFAGQLMLPEWMIDVPDQLAQDWYVFARPAGKRCFVVSTNGTTVSRLRNGSILNRFPSALPNGARARDASGSAQSYSILDCIFHESDQTYYVIDMVCWRGYSLYDCTAEFRFFWLNSKLAERSEWFYSKPFPICSPQRSWPEMPLLNHIPFSCIFHESDQTYYVIDMVCWRGYSLYDCTAEFRFFWLNSKLAETGACDQPSYYHRYRFCLVQVYNCDQAGLSAAYVPYVKDGLIFYNKHAHYQTGNTPLALVWKDENCSQYVIDTDSKGQIPSQQQVVLELQDNGNLTTSDDPPVVFGFLDEGFVQKSGLHPGNLLRFAISEGGLSFVDGKLARADLKYLGKSNRARAFADSYSKVVFQHMARHSPLQFDDLLASIGSSIDQEDKPSEVEMVG